VLKHICIVSSGQPSANPRAVKEATALLQHGFKVSFIFCPISPWADDFDVQLFETYHQVNWIKAGFHSSKEKNLFFYARLRCKFWKLVCNLTGANFGSGLKSLALFTQELTKKALAVKADLYIGHNLGALSAIRAAAQKHNAAYAFDAEDYHSGESNDEKLQKLVTKIEDEFYPQLSYLTTASQLSSVAYKKRYNKLSVEVIDNVFSKTIAVKNKNRKEDSGLKLFWFSQFIGKDRGIEVIIEAINSTSKNDIDLTLLGNISPEYKEELLAKINNRNQLIFEKPMQLESIFEYATKFDIGMASESNTRLNNDTALSNKIFCYVISSLAILFSNTQAQKLFYEKYTNIGELYSNADDLANKLLKFYNDKSYLQACQQAAYQLGQQKLNWEVEQNNFISLVNSVI
jgi:glycosyltransferase involved in cell wall biosynthesis